MIPKRTRVRIFLVYLHIKRALVKYLIILLARISLRNFKVDIEDIGEGEAWNNYCLFTEH